MMAHEETLFEAIKRGDFAVLQSTLAANPAFANMRDENGISPLMHARYRNRMDMVDAIIASGGKIDLWEASALGRAEDVARLAKADPAAVNAFSSDGFAPIHFAAFFGDAATVKALIDAGADVNLVSRERMTLTPLHQAAVTGKREMLALLLDYGADPNPVHEDGYSPLHAAASSGDLVSIRRLLTMGANASAKYQGKTAADLATEKGHSEAAAAIRAEMTD